jgi:glycine reductase
MVFAETVVNGDPTYVGPLAGLPLGLPVFHVLDSEVKVQADERVYDEQVGIMEAALPADVLVEAVKRIRGKSSRQTD